MVDHFSCCCKAMERAQGAETRAGEETAKAAALQEGLDSLNEKLAGIEAHCTTLQAELDTKGSALEALESVLGRIEHAVTTKRGAEASAPGFNALICERHCHRDAGASAGAMLACCM